MGLRHNVIHLYFTDEEFALLKARAESECRPMRSIIKAAALFYSRFGMWKLSETEITEQMKILTRDPQMKL